MTRQPNVWCSIILFIISYRLRALKTLYFHLCKFKENKKINLNNFCKEFCKKLWKKIILGTSDTCSTSHLSQQTSVLYCRLSDFYPPPLVNIVTECPQYVVLPMGPYLVGRKMSAIAQHWKPHLKRYHHYALLQKDSGIGVSLKWSRLRSNFSASVQALYVIFHV